MLKTVSQVAEQKRCSTSGVHRAIAAHKIQTMKVGAFTLVMENENLKDWQPSPLFQAAGAKNVAKRKRKAARKKR